MLIKKLFEKTIYKNNGQFNINIVKVNWIIMKFSVCSLKCLFDPALSQG